jgi:hypothetical protein
MAKVRIENDESHIRLQPAHVVPKVDRLYLRTDLGTND